MNGAASTNLVAAAPVTVVDRWLFHVFLLVPLAGLLLFFALPMCTIFWRSFILTDGSIGLSNYLDLWRSPGVWRALFNSLWLGFSTMAITLLLGFVLAYGVERTRMPGRRFVMMCLSLPVLAPSLVLGLGLIFLLGRNGLIGQWLGIRIEIYGFWGLLIADVMYALPQAVMILRASLRFGDSRQYEAAEVIGASAWRQFRDITLPGMRYGALSAAFVVFTVTITDFGNAVVIGGNFPVLATEIYNQVFGQMRFGMGAVVGLLLLLPSAFSVWIERVTAQRQTGLGAESAVQPVPKRQLLRDGAFFAVCMTVSCSLLAVIVTVVSGSFMRLWPYKMEFTFKHYAITLAGGHASLWTSLGMSVLTAVLGTLLLVALTISVRRLPEKAARRIAWLSALPVGVPGVVLGLAYVFAFNTATMPWGALYGTLLLVALCNFYHYHTQAYVTMATGVRAVPTALEEACTVLGGGAGRVLRDVFLPVLRPTLWAVGLFLFMRSMVTLSAVIFLITPSLNLAAVTVMRLDEAGFTSQAAAFSTCIMVVVGIASITLNGLSNRKARPTV
ncbi:ABC transporter permease subunit [Noviherbaspirillum saxi]|uniref:ABC transporter permease subunit n=2 Tax=Noviherbaspirillum saxi TaxID=2320863 RepID=A0A3A3FKP5_9BURK|nr:ABC transporter permease subunit [Noviherbaspirillum saxi]